MGEEELQKSLDELRAQYEAVSKELESYKSLGDLDKLKELSRYSELGSYEDIRDALDEYEEMLEERRRKPAYEPTYADKDVAEIRAGMLKAFPELSRLLVEDEEELERQEVYIDSSVERLEELAKEAGLPVDNEDDVYYLASLVTAQIQRDPKEHKKYVAGDLKVLDRAFWSVAERVYGKKRAPTEAVEGLPKTGGRRSGVGISEETPKSLEAATDRAYERFRSMQTG